MQQTRLPIGSLDLPTYFPLVADATGLRVGLQSGSEQLIPWSMIRSVDVGRTYIRRNVPTVTVQLSKPEGEPAILDIVPCKPGWELFGILKPGETRKVVDAILRARVSI